MKVGELLESLKGFEDYELLVLDKNLNYLTIQNVFKDYRNGEIKLEPDFNDNK